MSSLSPKSVPSAASRYRSNDGDIALVTRENVRPLAREGQRSYPGPFASLWANSARDMPLNSWSVLFRRGQSADLEAVDENVGRRGDDMRNRLRHVLRSQHPARVRARRKARRDRARIHRRHLHTVLAHLEHQALREAGRGVLGCRVGRAANERAAAGDRADDNDMSTPPLDHARQNRTGHVKERVEIEGDDAVPFLGGQVEQRFDRTNAGIVDEDVALDVAERAVGRRVIGEVERDCSTGAVPGFDLSRERLELWLRSSDGDDVYVTR